MCGFAAMIGTDGARSDRAVVNRMAKTIAHRGPDDVGSFHDEWVSLAFRRLSILDLSPAGHQPFCSEDGNRILVFNGEIFNFEELRRELRTRGHSFRSTGDTEVLLRAYEEWGTQCLSRLNGMWAFLLFDRTRGLVFGSRDRFGIKPLYMRRTTSHIFFASEIKAVLAGAGPSEPNWSHAAAFLASGRLENVAAGEETFYKDIVQIPAATGFTLAADGRMKSWRYWSLPEERPLGEQDPVADFRELFLDAVRLRLRSDVPVGVSLSGGMDSTSIISAVAMHRGAARRGSLGPLHAFSYMPPQFDEAPYVHATVAATGAELHRAEITPELMWEQLPALLRAHDEPVHSATAFVGYEIYRLAAEHGVKVILSGQGADETIGGYPPYFRDAWQTHLQNRQFRTVVDDVRDYCGASGASVARELLRTAMRFGLVAANQSPLYRRMMRSRRQSGAFPHRDLFDHDFSAGLAQADSSGGGLRNVLTSAVECTPLPLYLRIEDRNSMAHSVEARLPFLDYRLVSYAFQLPAEWKLRGRWNKYVLRQATRGIIPEPVRQRVDKMGFPTPVAAWFRGGLADRLQDLLSSNSTRERGIYDLGAIRRLLSSHSSGRSDGSSALFNILQFETWLEQVGEEGASAASSTGGVSMERTESHPLTLKRAL